MKVLRIVPNIATSELKAAKRFYEDILGFNVLMDLDWIATYGTDQEMTIQISFAAHGGANAAVPDLSVEVDDVNEAFNLMKEAGFDITYGPTNEQWGVRRFFVEDPFGKCINILEHL